MKRTLLTIAIVLFTLASQAQTAVKVHSDGTLSLQSSLTSGGVQIQTNGYTSFEPDNITHFAKMQQTKPGSLSSKCWLVNNTLGQDPREVYYVSGSGNVYCYHLYHFQEGTRGRGIAPIENASELVSRMKGYYSDSDEFAGNPEDVIGNENVAPEAVEGLLSDMEKTRSLTMDAGELEAVLPEAVRHTDEGNADINYNALVTVLIEAFKEQQARIDELEAILEENGLLRK